MPLKSVKDFFEHLNKDHSLPDICCPNFNSFLAITKEEAKALFEVLKYEYISQEHELAHDVIRAIQNFIQDNE